jgi:hypothetical protein
MKAFSFIILFALVCGGVSLAAEEMYNPSIVAVTVINHTKTGAWFTLYGSVPAGTWRIQRAECVQPGSSRVMVAHFAGEGQDPAAIKVRAEPMEGYECKGRKVSDLDVLRQNFMANVEGGRVSISTTLSGGDGHAYQLTRI